MEDARVNYAPLIFGGLFVGFWVYGWTFGFPTDEIPWQSWLGFGFLGVGIGSALFATRFINTSSGKAIVITIVGVLLGVLILAAILEENASILASILTTIGVSLIAVSFPNKNAPVRPASATPVAARRR